MKLKGYAIKYFSHDEKHYWLRYSPPGDKTFTLTIPIKKNNMFQFRTTAGFQSFMSCVPHFCSEFKDFAGAAQLIPDDEEDTVTPPPPPHVSSHKFHYQTKEPSDQTRETIDTLDPPLKFDV